MSKRDEILHQLNELGQVQLAYQNTMKTIQQVFEKDPAEVSRMVNATNRAMKRVTRKQNELSKSLTQLDKQEMGTMVKKTTDQYTYREGDEAFRTKFH